MPVTNESPSELRQKLEAALAENTALKGQVAEKDTTIGSLTGSNLLMEGGLGYLNETQRAAVLTMHNGDTVTKESLLATAKSLGYEPKMATTTTTTTTPPNQTPPPNTNPENQPDPPDIPMNVDATLRSTLADMAASGQPIDPAAAMEAIQRIQTAASGATLRPGETFEQRIKGTNSPEELDHLLMTQGAANGIILGSELD